MPFLGVPLSQLFDVLPIVQALCTLSFRGFYGGFITWAPSNHWPLVIKPISTLSPLLRGWAESSKLPIKVWSFWDQPPF